MVSLLCAEFHQEESLGGLVMLGFLFFLATVRDADVLLGGVPAWRTEGAHLMAAQIPSPAGFQVALTGPRCL